MFARRVFAAAAAAVHIAYLFLSEEKRQPDIWRPNLRPVLVLTCRALSILLSVLCRLHPFNLFIGKLFVRIHQYYTIYSPHRLAPAPAQGGRDRRTGPLVGHRSCDWIRAANYPSAVFSQSLALSHLRHCCRSLMIIALASQFCINLPWVNTLLA